MPTVSTAMHVAAIARQYPATIKVFQRHRIDFCCGGKRPLAAACAGSACRRRVLAEVQAAAEGPQPEGDWAPRRCRRWWPTSSGAITGPCAATSRCCASWPRRWPPARRRHAGAARGARSRRGAAAEMTSHMQKEEKVLFPMIARLAAPAPAVPPRIDAPVRPHGARARGGGSMLATLRALTTATRRRRAPATASAGSTRCSPSSEADTHAHIHLENNVLFPRAEELVLATAATSAG